MAEGNGDDEGDGEEAQAGARAEAVAGEAHKKLSGEGAGAGAGAVPGQELGQQLYVMFAYVNVPPSPSPLRASLSNLAIPISLYVRAYICF